MIARRDYLNNKYTHEQYYSQFVDDGLVDFVARHFTTENLVEAYETDHSFNNIPLQRWDNLAWVIYTDKLKLKLQEAGDYPTLGNAVCILKQAAHIVVSGRTE